MAMAQICHVSNMIVTTHQRWPRSTQSHQ